MTALLAVVAAVPTFADIGRFWTGLFLGPARGHVGATSALLVAPVVDARPENLMAIAAWDWAGCCWSCHV